MTSLENLQERRGLSRFVYGDASAESRDLLRTRIRLSLNDLTSERADYAEPHSARDEIAKRQENGEPRSDLDVEIEIFEHWLERA